jgi:hypothetical protein
MIEQLRQEGESDPTNWGEDCGKAAFSINCTGLWTPLVLSAIIATILQW